MTEMTDTERLGLWGPCLHHDTYLGSDGEFHGDNCTECPGTGRVLNPAAVKAARAIVEDALDYAATYPNALLTPWAMGKKQQLEEAVLSLAVQGTKR